MVKMLTPEQARAWETYADAIGMAPREPIAITSPEQAASLYGAGFGEAVNATRTAPMVFVRVPVTE